MSERVPLSSLFAIQPWLCLCCWGDMRLNVAIQAYKENISFFFQTIFFLYKMLMFWYRKDTHKTLNSRKHFWMRRRDFCCCPSISTLPAITACIGSLSDCQDQEAAMRAFTGQTLVQQSCGLTVSSQMVCPDTVPELLFFIILSFIKFQQTGLRHKKERYCLEVCCRACVAWATAASLCLFCVGCGTFVVVLMTVHTDLYKTAKPN